MHDDLDEISDAGDDALDQLLRVGAQLLADLAGSVDDGGMPHVSSPPVEAAARAQVRKYPPGCPGPPRHPPPQAAGSVDDGRESHAIGPPVEAATRAQVGNPGPPRHAMAVAVETEADVTRAPVVSSVTRHPPPTEPYADWERRTKG